jgi:branched-chain amino acid transport system substrate-binding protein
MKVIKHVCLALTITVASSQAFAAAPIKIAVAGPVTGPLTQYGQMQTIGSRMAIDDINKAGGAAGRQLEFVAYDDACDPKQAVAVANKIVNDGIHLVLGHLCSNATQPAAKVYDDENILMISPAATNPHLTRQGFRMVFRTIGTDNMQGPTAAEYIATRIKPKNVAVIHDKQQYGEGVATAAKKVLDGKKVNVVMFEGINAGDKDFSSLVARLKKAEVDFVYYGGYHPELGMLMRQSAEKGLKTRFMGPESAGNAEITAIAGKASEGLLVTLPRSYDQDPANQALVARFKAKGQDPSGPFVLTSYAAIQVLAGAVVKAGSDDPEQVAAAIRANSFATPMGSLSFDDNGDLKDFSFVVYEWHADGSKTQAP